MLIGDKLHEIRKKKKITLVEIAKKSGIQIATLSRIENKKMTGTIESHMAIAKALGIDVVELYNSVIKDQKQVELSEATHKSEVFTHNDKSSFEILTKNVLSKQMMPTLIRIEEGGSTQKEQCAINSEKFLFILEGMVDVMIEAKPIRLERYSTLYFDSSLPHHIRNVGQKVSKVICVATPVAL